MVRPSVVVALVAFCVIAVSAQAPRLSFEVASVKYRGDQPLLIPPIKSSPNVFYRSGERLEFLIRLAYDLQKFQVIGGPDWIRTSFFEINAKAAGEASPEQMRQMLQSLLEDRFKLVVRRDQQEMRYLALLVAREDGRLGSQLARCADPAKLPEPRSVRLPLGGFVTQRSCAQISEIAKEATGVVGSPVVDKTGLSGVWNFELAYERPGGPTPAERQRLGGADSEVPPFPTALQEQLGLKLERQQGPVDVLVIDSVQQPTEN